MTADVRAHGPSAPRWAMVTAIGCAVAITASTLFVGATSRWLSPFAGGILVVLYFGAVAGLVLGALLLAVLPRHAARPVPWLFANALGAAVGYALAAVVGEVLGNAIDPSVNVIVGEGIIEDLSGAVIGIALAYAQWRMLRPLIGARVWIVATAVGAGLGYGAASAALEVFEIPLLKANMVPSFGLILGVFIGVAQALVLRSLREHGPASVATRPERRA